MNEPSWEKLPSPYIEEKHNHGNKGSNLKFLNIMEAASFG